MLEKLGWTVDAKGGIVITPNPDNQIQATVLREDIQLPRALDFLIILAPTDLTPT